MAKAKSTGIKSYEVLLKEIQSGVFHPVYLLYGNEPYFIDDIEHKIVNKALTEQEKAFNLSVLYGKEIEAKQVFDHAMQFPMMAERRVIVVREAQAFSKIDGLIPYLKAPSQTSILVLCYKREKLDGRTAFAKTIKKHAVLLESKLLRDYQVPNWLTSKLKTLGYSITPEAAALIAEHTGTMISKIMNELEKLFLNIPKQALITPELVKKYIGVSRQISVFEFINAIGKVQYHKAFELINRLESQDDKGILPLTVIMLYRHFKNTLIVQQNLSMGDSNLGRMTGVNPYFIKDFKLSARNYSPQAIRRIISLLLKYDLKAKGLDTWRMPEFSLLKELTIKILRMAG